MGRLAYVKIRGLRRILLAGVYTDKAHSAHSTGLPYLMRMLVPRCLVELICDSCAALRTRWELFSLHRRDFLRMLYVVDDLADAGRLDV